MEAVKVVIATYDDWEGLYVNGELRTEGHSINLHDFVDLINDHKVFESMEVVEISEGCLEEHGNCPMNLDDMY
ncbi:hypothetical protein ABE073_04965 [Lederbergia citrisecunda]|uniref:hypothetical protein n=1 Tax=Lederbergia citrisecunda TaxID=2833583 RepID=UPI003D2D3FBD